MDATGRGCQHEPPQCELRCGHAGRTAAGAPRTYWNANLPGSFTDVLFVEELRAMVLSRFPNLNADKVYATGFSLGGGLTFTLACYRSSLFRGFSVAAKTLGTDG